MPDNNKKEPATDRTDEFLQLFMSNQHRVYSYILTMVSDWSDTEDIMQETTRVMWQKFDKFQSGTNFPAWGVSIAHFEILKHRKKNANSINLSDEVLEQIVARRQGRPEQQHENIRILQDCLQQLDPRDRGLLNLRYQQGNTIKEIALILNRPVHGLYKTVSRIHYALTRCVKHKQRQENV